MKLTNTRRKVKVNNSSGTTGVSWSKKTSKWRAVISFNKIYNYLGSFSDYYEAVKIRKSVEAAYNILKALGATSIQVKKSKGYSRQIITAIISKDGQEPLIITIQGASYEG